MPVPDRDRQGKTINKFEKIIKELEELRPDND